MAGGRARRQAMDIKTRYGAILGSNTGESGKKE